MKAKCPGSAAAWAALLLLAVALGGAQAATSPASVEKMATPQPGGGGEMRHGKRPGKMMKELDLTPEQNEKFKAQRKEQSAAMKKVRESIRAKREELRDELDKEQTDPAKIEAITSELKKLEGDRVDQEVKGILGMKETLTPEQFKKLRSREHRGGRHERPGEWRGPRRGRGHDEGRGPRPVPAAPEAK